MSVTLFFDLDGTLCAPRERFAQVFDASCAPLLAIAPEVTTADLLAAWSVAVEEPGPATTASCIARVCEMCDVRASSDLIEQCAETQNATWARTQTWMPDAQEMLSTLTDWGARIGLLTNGPSDAQRAVVSALGLDAWCRWIVVSGDAEVGVRKPEPGVFAFALTLAGARAETSWFVGDNPVNDIAGAARAGMRTCWLARPGKTYPADVPPPTARVTSLADLPALLAAHA